MHGNCMGGLKWAQLLGCKVWENTAHKETNCAELDLTFKSQQCIFIMTCLGGTRSDAIHLLIVYWMPAKYF